MSDGGGGTELSGYISLPFSVSSAPEKPIRSGTASDLNHY